MPRDDFLDPPRMQGPPRESRRFWIIAWTRAAILGIAAAVGFWIGCALAVWSWGGVAL